MPWTSGGEPVDFDTEPDTSEAPRSARGRLELNDAIVPWENELIEQESPKEEKEPKPKRMIDEYLIDEATQHVRYARIRRSYFGRGMRIDEPTFGIMFLDIKSVTRWWIQMGYYADEFDTDAETLEALFESARHDNMGQGVILYFPGWELDNDDD